MRRAAALLPIALMLAVPLAAQAGTKIREKTKFIGESVSASWSYTNGDIFTFVSVVASNNNTVINGEKSEDAFATVSIVRVDLSTDTVLISGSAETNNFTFHLDNNLSQATLSIPNVVFQNDATFTFFDLAVNLTWTGTGDITSLHTKEKEVHPGFKLKSQFKSDGREGVATGSVFGNDIQFTPVPSETASLMHAKSGTMTIETVTP
jgi:hypothetical protein